MQGATTSAAHNILEHPQLVVLESIRNSLPFPHESLHSLLLLARSSEATDPRDKVYGILGLLNKIPDRLSIDYDQTVEEVYIGIVKLLSEQSKRLDFLSWVEERDPSFSSKEFKLPSWAPSGSRQMPGNYRMLAPGQHSILEMWSTRYQATTKTKFQGVFDVKAGLLRTDEAEIDNLLEVSSTCTSLNTAFGNEWHNFIARNVGADRLASETYWKIIRGDQWSHDERLGVEILGGCAILPQQEAELQEALENNTLIPACMHRTLFVSARHRYLGLAPATAASRDTIWALFGGDVLYFTACRRFL